MILKNLKHYKELLILVLLLSVATNLSAQTKRKEIDMKMVESEMVSDSLSFRCVNISEKYDYKVFYIDDICIVHIQQYSSGVMYPVIQRFYKYQNGQWVFMRESSLCDGYELEQIGKNLFHAYKYKGSPAYEALRYESVMRCDSFEMKPIFEYSGVDYTIYLINKYINGAVDYFNTYMGDTICNDNEVFDIEVVDNDLKSYKLKHTVKILNGFDTEQNDLLTTDSVTIKTIVIE